jgi:hypothetical protein
LFIVLRRRWPDVVIVLALVGLAAGGALAIWHDELWRLVQGEPVNPPVEEQPASDLL